MQEMSAAAANSRLIKEAIVACLKPLRQLRGICHQIFSLQPAFTQIIRNLCNFFEISFFRVRFIQNMKLFALHIDTAEAVAAVLIAKSIHAVTTVGHPPRAVDVITFRGAHEVVAELAILNVRAVHAVADIHHFVIYISAIMRSIHVKTHVAVF